jgi:hypothetical protein
VKTGIGGSAVAGGSLCRDDKNLYARIDFSDGKPWSSGAECWRVLDVYQLGTHFNMGMYIWSDGTAHPMLWSEKTKKSVECGRFAVGPSFVELSFPISFFPKEFDPGKPFTVQAAFGDKAGRWTSSRRQEVVLEK